MSVKERFKKPRYISHCKYLEKEILVLGDEGDAPPIEVVQDSQDGGGEVESVGECSEIILEPCPVTQSGEPRGIGYLGGNIITHKIHF